MLDNIEAAGALVLKIIIFCDDWKASSIHISDTIFIRNGYYWGDNNLSMKFTFRENKILRVNLASLFDILIIFVLI